MFRSGITKLETVNKNFKTISVIQKALVVNEQTKKLEFKSVKIFHVNDSESKLLIETFSKLEMEAEKSEDKKAKESTDSSKLNKDEKELNREININKVEKTETSVNVSPPASQKIKSESNENQGIKLASYLKDKTPAAGDISQKSAVNINRLDNSSKQSSANNENKQIFNAPPLTENMHQEENNKSKVTNQTIGFNPSQSVIATENKDNLTMNGYKTVESKNTDNIEINNSKKIENISIHENSKQTPNSKTFEKPSLQQDLVKPSSKEIVSTIKLEQSQATESKQSKSISVGKITNINIQLVVSSRSNDSTKN